LSVILQNSTYQDVLYSVFDEYHSDLEDILELATIESNGKRPQHLTNEIYSLFHHISRSICHITDVQKAIEEVNHAKKSHLKRAILDSYKIAVNKALIRVDKAYTLLEDLSLDSDYRQFIDNTVCDLKEIDTSRKTIKKCYLGAKKHERKGDVQSALFFYNLSLEKINDLSLKIKEIEENIPFNLALKRIKKFEIEKKKSKRFSVGFSIFIAILSCVLTALCTHFVDSLAKNKKIDTQQQEITSSSILYNNR
jgi:hypothetical protein